MNLIAKRIVRSLSGGSSQPLLVETQRGRFVVKLVHGPEGPRALAAEWIVSGIALAIGLPVAESAIIEVEPELARSIEHQELREAAARGAGISFGARELVGAKLARTEEIDKADDDFAMRLLWLDTLVENPDRTAKNPNILSWGASLVPIDHGAALPFHHRWRVTEASPSAELEPTLDHVYASRRVKLAAWHDRLAALVSRETLRGICASVPDVWLGPIVFATPARQRSAYAAYLWKRMRALRRA